MTVPDTCDEWRNALASRHEDLSRRLQQIAEFTLDNPNDMALETVSGIAERASVQPSSLIRFAKAFGYSGFGEMQRVFRAHLAESGSNYKHRIRSLGRGYPEQSKGSNIVLDNFVNGEIAALNNLREVLNPKELDEAIEYLKDADIIYLAGTAQIFSCCQLSSPCISLVGQTLCSH